MAVSRRKGKSPLRCDVCKKSVVDLISVDEFDFDETPTDVGFKTSSGFVVCSDCERHNREKPTLKAKEKEDEEKKDDTIFDDPRRIKPIIEKHTARALASALDLADQEELDEVDDLVDKVLKPIRLRKKDGSGLKDVILSDDLDNEKPKKW